MKSEEGHEEHEEGQVLQYDILLEPVEPFTRLA